MLSNIRVKARQPLADLIPLPTPLMLRIDPTNLCNLACVFCPNGDKNLLHQFNIPQGIMKYELFKKNIDDLGSFESKLKKLLLYKDGEPLLNPRLTDMIQYAKEKDVAEQIWIFTNGTLLNPRINQKLIKAGLDLIQISIYAVSDEGYYKICNKKIEYKKLVENIGDLYKNRNSCHIHVKILNPVLSSEMKIKFVEDFERISDSINIESLHGWSMSNVKDFTLGTKPKTTVDGLAFFPKEICSYPFYSLAVNFNGIVSVCCVDWSHSTVVGDSRKKSLREIWEGKELFEFRIMHLKKERYSNLACNKCQHLLNTLDYIDDRAEEILQRLLRKK